MGRAPSSPLTAAPAGSWAAVSQAALWLWRGRWRAAGATGGDGATALARTGAAHTGVDGRWAGCSRLWHLGGPFTSLFLPRRSGCEVLRAFRSGCWAWSGAAGFPRTPAARPGRCRLESKCCGEDHGSAVAAATLRGLRCPSTVSTKAQRGRAFLRRAHSVPV